MSKNLIAVDLRRRKFFKVAGLLGLMPWLKASAATAAADSLLRWNLTEGRVVSAGREVEMAEGVLVENFVIEGKARALNAGFLQAANFKLMLQAFSPAKDMGKQIVGHWYIKGVWTLNESLAQGDPAVRQWNRAGVLKSQFLAETEHDPRLASSNWRAEFSILPGRFTPLNANESAFALLGQGSLAMNAGFEGTLSLALR